LDRRSVIPYVYGRIRVVLLCVMFNSKVEVERTCLLLVSTRTFYSSRSDSYNETQGTTGGTG
jgi:hypothetical protein